MIDFSRDFNFSFFGFKTLENSYLHKLHYKNGDSEIINTTSTIDLIESDPYSRLETVFFSNLLGEEKKTD